MWTLLRKEKRWNMRVTFIQIVCGALFIITKRSEQGTGGAGNKRVRGDHPNYSIVKIGQNTEDNPGDFRRLAATQTPVIDHQVLLV